MTHEKLRLTLDEWLEKYLEALNNHPEMTIEEYADIISGDSDRANFAYDTLAAKAKSGREYHMATALPGLISGRQMAFDGLATVGSQTGAASADKGVKAFIELQGKKKDAAMGLAADVYEYQKLIKELLVELMEENDKYSGPGVDEKE